MTEVLNIINKQLSDIGLNYEFGQMTKSPPTYPYWVGDYTESATDTEDGKEESTLILTGFSRGPLIDFEAQKQAIKDHYKHGVSVITKSGAAVVIFYSGSLNIPLEEFNLKKCQVNLSIKLWKE